MPPSDMSHVVGYAYVIPEQEDALNAFNGSASGGLGDGESVLDSSGEGHLVMVNGTLIRILFNKPFRDSERNELLYVIIVIVFYATALMTLIITQIKRQRREGMDVDYYDEYLQRNQEVKKTCRTATSIVIKPSSSSSASASTTTTTTTTTTLTAPADRALLLGPPGARGARDLSPRFGPRGVGRAGAGAGAGTGAGGEEGSGFLTPSPSPRELSPMLESIPDIGT